MTKLTGAVKAAKILSDSFASQAHDIAGLLMAEAGAAIAQNMREASQVVMFDFAENEAEPECRVSVFVDYMSADNGIAEAVVDIGLLSDVIANHGDPAEAIQAIEASLAIAKSRLRNAPPN